MTPFTFTCTVTEDGPGWYRAERDGVWCGGPTPLAAVAGLVWNLNERTSGRPGYAGQIVTSYGPTMTLETTEMTL